MPYTQERRLIAVDTPLGRDVLLLAEFKGRESISTLFSFELSMLSENHSISFEDVIGKNVTVSVTLADGNQRYFNGVVSRFSQGRGGGERGTDTRFSYYSATVVPWLWLLTRTADSRIFQSLSAPDIIEKIFTEKGFRDFRMSLRGNYEKRDYCVQYRETDFNFISRLLEEEGIFYYFEHESGKHTLVLGDTSSEHRPCPGQAEARCRVSFGGFEDDDVITAVAKSQEIRAGKYTQNDYNFEMPNTDLKVDVTSRNRLGPGEREIYDYPGIYLKRPRGDQLTTVRMEEEEAQITFLSGESNCRSFTTGYRFTLKDHYRDDINNKAFVLRAIDHYASNGSGYAGSGGMADAAYSNRFECIPFDSPFRPPRVAVKPFVHGTQTAIVVGPAGEEIYTDQYARVKVQFHWDREGKKDENSSCWMRVGQLWASAGWGAVYIPRIGQEVIVDFLEGDPDRPIVIGCVYHGNNKPPYDLPSEKTKSTIKSDSTVGGGGFNEIRFEDKKGQEEFYLHAQRDMNTEVERDESYKVGRDRMVDITRHETRTVQGNQDETVLKNITLTCGQGATVTYGPSGLSITSAGPISITAPSITLNAATVSVSGTVQCAVLTTGSVVSPLYTTGVGNLV